jgi:hypothetical protein
VVEQRLEQLVTEATGEQLVEQPGKAGTGGGADGVLRCGDAPLVTGGGFTARAEDERARVQRHVFLLVMLGSGDFNCDPVHPVGPDDVDDP